MLLLSNVFKKNVTAFKDESLRYVINQGGSSCFHGKQSIVTDKGVKYISDIVVGDIVMSYDSLLNKNVYKPVTDVMAFQNEKKCYEVVLSNGDIIRATEDHKFYYKGGWCSLRHVLSLSYGNMEANTELQPLPSIKYGSAPFNELQALWKDCCVKACNFSRWILKNHAAKRRWKIQQLDRAQVCHTSIPREIRETSRDRPFGWCESQQCNIESGSCDKVRKHKEGICSRINNTQEGKPKWELKASAARRNCNKTPCKKWWSLLWEKVPCGKVRYIGSACEGFGKQTQECLARCIAVEDIVSFKQIDIDVVYDITVKGTHCFYLSCNGGYLVHNSSKTFSLLQLLTRIAMTKKKQIDIVGLTTPHLKAGVLNDMPHVMNTFGLNFDDMFNKTDRKLKFPSGGVINFLAVDSVGKAHGGRRDILYMNEANHIPYLIAEQLMMRTRDKVLIDYNPTAAFWAQTVILKDEPDKSLLIKSTYKDNPSLEQSIIDQLESKAQSNPNFYRVYVLGEMGIPEGLVFNNFEQKTFDKERFSEYRHGVDWGWVDPFAYVRAAIDKNSEGNFLYLCDEIYESKLENEESAQRVKRFLGGDRVTCDSAEPKSIRYFQSREINAQGAKKGQGSIMEGIKFLQSFDKIFIHPDCTHIWEEFNNYAWKVNKNGEETEVPIDLFNHAIDSLRYAIEGDQNYLTTKLVGRRPF